MASVAPSDDDGYDNVARRASSDDSPPSLDEAPPGEYSRVQAQNEATSRAETISEASLDLAFIGLELLFSLSALVVFVVGVTTATSLEHAAAALLATAGALEAMKRFIKSLEQYRSPLPVAL